MEEIKYFSSVCNIDRDKIMNKSKEFILELTKCKYNVAEAEEVVKAMKESIAFRKKRNIL